MANGKAYGLTLGVILLAAAAALSPMAAKIKAGGGQDAIVTARLAPELAEVFGSLQPAADRLIYVNGGKISQIGDKVRVVVNLKEPLSQNFPARGYAGIGAVKVAIAKAQDRVLRRLDANDFDLSVRLDLNYSFAGYATESAVRALMAMPEVDSIIPDYLNELRTVQGRAMTRSDYAASTLGYTGAGNTVAMIDSAMDYLHTELGASTPKNDSNTSASNSVVAYMKDFSTPDNDVYPADWNDGYHGTGTSAIVHRYAPGAKLVMLQVFPNAYDSTIASAINWCVTNKNVASGSPITLINMSLGGGKYTGSCSTGTIQSAVDNAKTAGIVCFVATGNDGWTNAIGSPACDPDVIAMGAVWDANNAAYSPFPPAYCSDSTRVANERTCYSDASPELDLYAPSEEVITAQVFGGTFALGGTSSATPAAAGLCAQLFEAKPSLKGSVSQIKTTFQSTGVAISGNPNAAYQNKRIDVTAAIQGTSNPAPVVNSFSASPSSISAGSSSTLSWNCSDTTSVSISGVSGTFGATGSTTVTPAATTTYTLTATGAGGTATASATVTVTGGGASESEPNGSTSYADVLSNAVNTTGYISSSSDLDYFKITIGPRKIATITLQVPASKDYDLKLYNSSGYLLGTSQNDTGISESISVQNTSYSYNRTYYIKVYGYAGAYSTTESYVVKAAW